MRQQKLYEVGIIRDDAESMYMTSVPFLVWDNPPPKMNGGGSHEASNQLYLLILVFRLVVQHGGPVCKCSYVKSAAGYGIFDDILDHRDEVVHARYVVAFHFYVSFSMDVEDQASLITLPYEHGYPTSITIGFWDYFVSTLEFFGN